MSSAFRPLDELGINIVSAPFRLHVEVESAVLLGKLSRKHVNFLDNGWLREELGSLRHQRSGDFAREVRLTPFLVWKSVEDPES